MHTLTEKSLFETFTPLVLKIAGGLKRKLPSNILYEDLVAAGMSGLWDVVRRYPNGDGAGFEKYVRIRIRGAILDALRAQDWLPRRARATAEAKGLLPTAIARMDDMTELDQEQALGLYNDVDALIDDLRFALRLRAAVEQLPPRERKIAVEHYYKGRPFVEIAQELQVSGPRISQLHARILARLKRILERTGEDEPTTGTTPKPPCSRRHRVPSQQAGLE